MRQNPWWRAILFRAISCGFISLLASCSFVSQAPVSPRLNSRYNDEQPSLSGNGRWLAFVSNRNGSREILVYDLREQRLVDYPGLNQGNAIAESPSLSRTGRYVVYLSSLQGRPDVALYDRATKRTEIVTLNYRGWVRNPQISPDGRYIVFETSRRGQWDIEVLDRGPAIEMDIPNGSPVIVPSPQP